MEKSIRVSVKRWQGGPSPDSQLIEACMQAENLPYYRWSNGPGDVYGAHQHTYDKVIYIVQGTITFGLPEEGGQLTLAAGDRLSLPAGVVHNAVVGQHGVVCLEGHRSR